MSRCKDLNERFTNLNEGKKETEINALAKKFKLKLVSFKDGEAMMLSKGTPDIETIREITKYVKANNFINFVDIQSVDKEIILKVR